MKRRTSTVDERPGSPAPSTCAGLTITTGSPRASEPQRHDFGLVLGVDVRDRVAAGVPDAALVGGRAFAAPARRRRPRTCRRARSTPARSASSSTIRVPSRLTRETSAPGPAAGSSCPRDGRPGRRRASPAGPRGGRRRRPQRIVNARSASDPRSDCGRTVTDDLVAPLDQQAGYVRADEAGRSGYERVSHCDAVVTVRAGGRSYL